jgi:LPXTG-motif cell wall-anchored protein
VETSEVTTTVVNTGKPPTPGLPQTGNDGAILFLAAFLTAFGAVILLARRAA